MAAEVTYAELRFKTESKPSDPNSDSPAAPKGKTTPQRSNLCFPKRLLVPLLLFILLSIVFTVAFIIFFQKYSQLLKEKTTVKESTQKHTELECKRSNSTKEEDKVWSCCPKNWKPFSSHCYFYPAKSKSWQESEEHCSSLEAHLVVITSEEEQHFITQYMRTGAAYYVGLSDPHGQRHWQWVDQTPYNESATFWHPNEPSSENEHCVLLNYRRKWGWNDVPCDGPQESVCEMTSICLVDSHHYTAPEEKTTSHKCNPDFPKLLLASLMILFLLVVASCLVTFINKYTSRIKKHCLLYTKR